MTLELLKGKIHRATVVQAELDYVGSITVDEEHKPAVVFVDEENKVNRVTNYERHGLLKDME